METLEGRVDENGSIHLSGKVNFDGIGTIQDFGFVISSQISLDTSQSRVYWVRGVGDRNDFRLRVTKSPFPKVMYIRAWARNSAGYGIGTVRKVHIDTIDPEWWGDIVEQPGGWKSSSWFGTFIQNDKNWLFHKDLGWLYSSPGQDGKSVWLWMENYGWLWTKEGVWPYLYKNDSASWLYFTTSRNGIPIFYDYSSGFYLNLDRHSH